MTLAFVEEISWEARGDSKARAEGQIARLRILELMRIRYGPSAARTAFEHALDDANLPEKAFYDPSEVERIADEFALRPIDRGHLIVFLLRREAALAAADGFGAAPADRAKRTKRR